MYDKFVYLSATILKTVRVVTTDKLAIALAYNVLHE